MLVLFTIIFIAALVGIAKPYVGRLTRKHFAGIAAAAFVCMIVAVPSSDGAAAAGDTRSSSTETAEASEQSSITPGLTDENYDRIEIGMSYEEVVEIFGEPGEKFVEAENMLLKTEGYQWKVSRTEAYTITFNNGDVSTKMR